MDYLKLWGFGVCCIIGQAKVRYVPTKNCARLEDAECTFVTKVNGIIFSYVEHATKLSECNGISILWKFQFCGSWCLDSVY